MELGSAQFRRALQNAQRYVADEMEPRAQQEGGNPQRPLFDACVRRYFDEGRSVEAAFSHLKRRIANSKSSRRDANETAVRAMLTCFFAWDRPEELPDEYFHPKATRANIGSHLVALSPSLRYRLRDGHIVRHIWTEAEFSVTRPYARLVAAGYLAHTEATLGQGTVRQIEFWHVRARRAVAWQSNDLRGSVPQVIAILDRIERNLIGRPPGAAA
jgi:hypothetical protein